MEPILIIFQFIILIFSVMIHEVAHGSMAFFLGDNTAKEEGRLSFNPVRHFDFFGSFLLPVMLFLASGGSVIFGWAKPVPFNPFNLRRPKKDSGLIALSGPVSNLLVAIFFGLVIRAVIFFNFQFLVSAIFLFDLIIWINLSLAVFNLIPIPPLDGAGVLFSLLPESAERFFIQWQRYGLFILMVLILFGFQWIAPIIEFLHYWIVVAGMSA